MKRLIALLICVAGVAFSAVPAIEFAVDSQTPGATWQLKCFAGASPLIRVDLKESGAAFTPAAGWGAFLWYGTNADWNASSVHKITGTVATNLTYIDFQAVSNDFPLAGTYYGGIVMSNTTQAIEWGRGYLSILADGGIASTGSIDWQASALTGRQVGGIYTWTFPAGCTQVVFSIGGSNVIFRQVNP